MTSRDPLYLGKLEAALNNLAGSITTPLVLPYAVALGAVGWQVGVIAALPGVASSLSQIPAAHWGAHTKRPRLYLLLAGGLGRLAWLVLGMLLLSDRADFPALLLLSTISGVSTGLLSPIWTAFLGQRVPEERRGSYFGQRNSLGGVAGLAGAFLAASLASGLGFSRGEGLALIGAAIASAGALAAQLRAVSVARPIAHSAGHIPAGGQTGVWRIPAVRRYVIYGSLVILGAGVAEPYFSVHFINNLHGSPQVATTSVAVAGATVMLAQGPWGRVLDLRGLRTVALGCLAVVVLVPLMWFAATDPIQAPIIWLLNGLMWAGLGLATFNLLLAISTDANRASVLAWVNTLQTPVGFAAPLAGGFLSDRAGIPAVFLVSAALLALCWLYFRSSFLGKQGTSQATNL